MNLPSAQNEMGPALPDKESETVTEVDVPSFAKLYGEPLLKLPLDLYIPPDALEVFLEAFEGPLDLLLYLIRRQNFNVLDIPMVQVTHQYLIYVDQIRTTNLELAGEYLLMAAMLLEIKSRMLLPVNKADSSEEVADPRAELVRRLLEYERMKLASQKINALPQLGRDFFCPEVVAQRNIVTLLPEVDTQALRQAWSDVLRRAHLNQRHTIHREHLSVREYMTHILRYLQSRRFVEFAELFAQAIQSGQGASVVVVNFIALLELSREALVEITQVEPFAPIYVRLSYQPVTLS
ncbi:MAG: segregation/condensation protein A [Ottowia sp.]|nr:segregation/condensation protein A [Ottowia sp.]